MNGNKIFVDSNILLYLLKGNKDATQILQDKEVFVSFITELEILSFPKISEEETSAILEVMNQFTVVDYNFRIKNETLRLRKLFNLKLPDAIILATSSYLNLPFYTADKKLAKTSDLNVEIILFEL